jgi:hypothetical protein
MGSTVVVWNPDRWGDDIISWMEERGIAVKVQDFDSLKPDPPPVPPPPPPITGKAQIGLHGPADGGFFFSGPGTFREFHNLRPGIIKVMTSHAPESIGLLRQEHPGVQWVVRVFQSFDDRNITPAEFLRWNLPDIERTLNVLAGERVILELHNEPNLFSEGYKASWCSGEQFNLWMISLIGEVQKALPGVDLMFPGLSPGPVVEGVRAESHEQFIDACRSSIARCQGLGIHLYWGHDTDVKSALALGDWYISQFPDMPIYVTESSRNDGADPDTMAADYVAFHRGLMSRPTVQGVCFFVVSASDQRYAHETWVDKNLAARIRALMV